MPSNEESNPDVTEMPDLTNKSVIKAMTLLRELGRHPKGVTVTEIAQAVGMTRPTAFRLLLSMEQSGFVGRNENVYTLGWEVARLGRLADPSIRLAALVQPILEDLAQQLHEAAAFVLFKDGLDFDIIAEASGGRMLSVSSIHTRPELHVTAFGKIMLAELPEERVRQILPAELPAYTRKTITSRDDYIKELDDVRIQAYAVLDNESEEGLFAVCVPCRDQNGRLLGAVSVTGPEQRIKTGRLPQLVENSRTASNKIAGILS